MPNYQISFDINGVFHNEPIPLAYDDPVLIDDDLFNNVLISENINTDFESVKNYVEVLGHTWDVDYYSPSESTTVNGGTITPTFADLKELQNDTAVGITLPNDVNSTSGLNIAFLGTNKIVDIDSKNVQSLSKDTEWIFQFVPGPKLPSGYTELEYIQSSGTQYIDTGFKPNQDTKISISMAFFGSAGENLLGSRNSSSDATNRFGIITFSSSSKIGSFFGSTATQSISLDSSIHNYTLSKAGLSVDGVSYGGAYTSSFSCTYPITLFAWNNGSNGIVKNSSKIIDCKIFSGEVLVRNFIPCKNSSGVIGLYDVIENQFYQNAGTGTFIAGPEIPSIEDKGGPFWRFMGHQQAQATSYDNNPSSPFYVGDPIGSSSVGRIRIVLYGGEYDNIYSDDLAQQRADFEIYQRSRLNDSISMETIPIPWMDANIVVSHRFGQKQEPSKYIVKSFSVDYATGGTMTINAITWYPYYEESEVV